MINDIVLEATHLTKTFPNMERKVLDDISLSVRKGDFISILGESGSGKSTLLTILGGMDKADSGTVNFDGYDLSSQSERQLALLRRTKLGFVFQFFNLAPYLTVEENIILPMVLDNKTAKNYQAKFDELVNYLKLDKLLAKMPNKLSGGEQQRVAIARGMIYNPDIIFLDEPTGNLDSRTATEIMELLRHLNKTTATTILQVTHSEQNARYGNRIIRIKDGAIAEETVIDIKDEAIAEETVTDIKD